MDRTAFIDGAVGEAAHVARLQHSAEAAQQALAEGLLGDEILSGFELDLAAAQVSAGVAHDVEGQRITSSEPLAVDLASVARPSGADVAWVTVWVKASRVVSGDVYDLDNVQHDLYSDEAAATGITVGAAAAIEADAVRPALEAGQVLVGDALVDAATAWDSLTVDTERRKSLSRRAGVVERALKAAEAAIVMVKARLEVLIESSSIDDSEFQSVIGTLALAADLTELAIRVTAVEAVANAAVTLQQLEDRTPDASETVKGLVKLADQAALLALAADNLAISPRRLRDLVATESRLGLTEYASQTEMQRTTAPTQSDFSRAVSLARLRTDLLAATDRAGLIEIATDAIAKAGTDTERAMTAAGVRAHGDARYATPVLNIGPLGTELVHADVTGYRWLDIAESAAGEVRRFRIADIPISPETLVVVGTWAGKLAIRSLSTAGVLGPAFDIDTSAFDPSWEASHSIGAASLGGVVHVLHSDLDDSSKIYRLDGVSVSLLHASAILSSGYVSQGFATDGTLFYVTGNPYSTIETYDPGDETSELFVPTPAWINSSPQELRSSGAAVHGNYLYLLAPPSHFLRIRISPSIAGSFDSITSSMATTTQRGASLAVLGGLGYALLDGTLYTISLTTGALTEVAALDPTPGVGGVGMTAGTAALRVPGLTLSRPSTGMVTIVTSETRTATAQAIP